MASHHSYHHHSTAAAAPSCCSGHYNPCCSQPPPPPPPHHVSPELLLESLSLLLQRHQSNHLNQHHARRNPNHSLHFQSLKLHSPLLGEDLLTSLLQRITALESSVVQLYASSSRNKLSFSLREAAARVIQSHFRAYLVRRSRTLSQLQDLAFIKSSFNSIKSSVSNRNRFDYGVVSQKAMDLLLKLDSIQGANPMIRDGKRSISGNIVRFLEFIDALSVKNHGHSRRPVKNVRYVRNGDKSGALNSNRHFSAPQKELVEKLSERVEKIRGLSRVFDEDGEDVELEGFQEFSDDGEEEVKQRVLIEGKHGNSKFRNGGLEKSTCGSKPGVNKTVSFAENGKLYRIYGEPPESGLNGDGSLSDGSNSSDDHSNHNEIEERNCTSQDANGEVFEDHNASSSKSGRNEYIEINSCGKDEDGRLVFSPPVPVKMDSRADLAQKRKVVKIVS